MDSRIEGRRLDWIRILLPAFILFFGVFRVPGAPPASAPPLIDRIVAEIDGEVLTRQDLRFYVWMETLRRPETAEYPFEVMAPVLLRQIADEILMTHWSEERIKEVDDEAIDRSTDRAMEEVRLLAPSQTQFEEWLRERGYDETLVRSYLRKREYRLWIIRTALSTRHHLRPSQLSGTETTREAAQEEPERIRLRHLLLRVPADADDRETSRVLVRALAIRREILDGLRFADAATFYSDDSITREDGGNLGWIQLQNLHPNLALAVAPLERFEVSLPARTSQGWHLLQLVDSETPTSIQMMERVRDAYNEVLGSLQEDRVVRTSDDVLLPTPLPPDYRGLPEDTPPDLPDM